MITLILTNGKKVSFKTGLSTNNISKNIINGEISQSSYFTGIESTLKVSRFGDEWALDITSTISSPGEKSGEYKKNIIKSSWPIKLNKNMTFFSLALNSQETISQFSGLYSYIPILRLLKSKNKNTIYKKYWGEIMLRKECHHGV